MAAVHLPLRAQRARRLGLGLGLCCLARPDILWAQPAWPPVSEAPHDAHVWLVRAQEAAVRRNYQGTLVVTAGGQVSASRLAHFTEGVLQAERIEWLDGESRTLVRLNETVHTLWPKSRLAVVEARDPRASFPQLLSAPDRRVLESYEWRLLGRDRVAGLEAEVALLRARDAWRFSQRLWSERQTGLLLRAEVLAANGQVLESVGFSELQLGIRPQIDALQAQVRRLDGYRVARPVLLPVSLDAEGWQMSALPSGFRELQCARRVLGPAADPQAPVVLQSIYTDGLTHVSLFIEPFRAERHQVRARPPTGATGTLTQRRDSHWITLVGDVPEETLQRFAEALTRRR